LLALAIAAACGKDPVGQQSGEVDAFGVGVSADRGGNGAGDRGDGRDGEGKRHITILDDCDPSDPGWAPTGGCALKKGLANVAEFDALLVSPLSLSAVGHPAWRNEPSYLKVESGEKVRVINAGGRNHTFTKVAAFGGGRVPPLNIGLTAAPECLLGPAVITLAPGAKLQLEDLPVGIHRFMCCIHPWMRALIRVTEDDDRKD